MIDDIQNITDKGHSGTELVIRAVGTVYETIEEGAYVNLQVKYGLIRLVNTKADLCEQIKNVDLECPIEKGIIAITKSVDLPKEIPPVSGYVTISMSFKFVLTCFPKGKYTVNADVFTKDDKHITCLTAQVVFGRKDSLGLFDL